jgi:hypothetical protein
MSIPSSALNVSSGMSMGQVVQLLEYANEQHEETVMKLKDLNGKLEVY